MADDLSRILERYRRIAQNSLSTIYGARRDVRKRKYKPKYLISDSFDLWLNAMEAWYVPFESGIEEEPVVFIATTTAEGKGEDEIRLVIGGAGKPVSTNLQAMHANDPDIPHTDVIPELDTKKNELKVTVKNLGAVKPGQYQGTIRVDRMPIARVRLLLE